MSNLTVRLPDSLHEKLKELAQAEGISINQFMVLAASEKMSALATEEYLRSEAKKGGREKLRRILRKVPDVEPDEKDRL
ncbi:MAG: toxin-antitoxin system HicB family antitoxin [Gammaproteobacteria bacterium]|nr:toxin-antitoxin system HicB family antitoxin [Gammaproteobacteria bacterium]